MEQSLQHQHHQSPSTITTTMLQAHHGQRPSLAGFDPFLTMEDKDDEPRGPSSSRGTEHQPPTLADLHANNVISQSKMIGSPRGQTSRLVPSSSSSPSPLSSSKYANNVYGTNSNNSNSVSPMSPHMSTNKEIPTIEKKESSSAFQKNAQADVVLDSHMIDTRQPMTPVKHEEQKNKSSAPVLQRQEVATPPREPALQPEIQHPQAVANNANSAPPGSLTENKTTSVVVLNNIDDNDNDKSKPKNDNSVSNHKRRTLPSPAGAARKLKGSIVNRVHRRTKSLEDRVSVAIGASTTAATLEGGSGHGLVGSSKPPPVPPLHSHSDEKRSHARARSSIPASIQDSTTHTTQLNDSSDHSSTPCTPNTGKSGGGSGPTSSARRLSASIVGGINAVRPRLESRSNSKSSGMDDTTSSGNGIVQELMDLKDKFMTLQMPSLAKPSPTSFLTGNSRETARSSEYEPSPFQMELPTLSEAVEVARLNDFVENYRRLDQNYDLEQLVGKSRFELQSERTAHQEHARIVQSLLECGDGLTIQGFLKVGSNPDDRLETVIFETQRHFIVVFRGRTDQQSKLFGNIKPKRQAVPLDADQETNIEVYSGFKEEYDKLERECFALVDKISEKNPFCDFVFTGYSFGAALATIAAARYATVRPMMRIGCLPMASPKVGFNMFRQLVNSLPNLKVTRIELGQDSKSQAPSAGGSHVGHTIVLHSSIGQQHFSKSWDDLVLAYRFDCPKVKKFKTTYPDLRNYVIALEECQALAIPWAVDFANTTGKGVVVNNEARLVV
mmetsp:Transcript_46871/g.114317  ORF Transcript_46871/g.114317 Transcript_46871/m.114317 type:complete len:783 (+) Transcript_46871:396-2744(+)